MSVDTSNLLPGEVIRNRNRLWRVDGVDGQVVAATALDGPTTTHRFYAPIENIEKGSLPAPGIDRMGNPQFQDLLIQSNRLSMLHGTAPLMSLQRSRVIPTEYQLTPVVMALDMPEVRLLLADDVGLGKTIEAGLITSELLARNRADRILIVTPANLRDQWRETFEHFFHINAQITDRRSRKAMEKDVPPGTSVWDYYSKHIVSIDYAKQSHIRNQILSQDWDMVIIDEAHQAARPHTVSATVSPSKQRWEFAQDITDASTHALLLTATPHNGYTDSYASLLNMVNPDIVSGDLHDPQINREIAKRHVVQRRREDVEEWFGDDDENPFPDRDQQTVDVDPTDYETTTYDAVRDYGDALVEAAKHSDNRTLAQWTVIHFLKRALSSPEALRRSLRNRKDKLTDRLNELESDDDVIEETAGISEEMAQANALDSDPGEEYSETELGERVERVVTGDRHAIEIELETLEETLEAAERITKTRDSKLQQLLDQTLPARFNSGGTIIFTKYVDTLEYLEEHVRDEFGDRVSVHTLYGELGEAERNERFQEFADAERGVLIATDVISEGMNLQYAANQVIHYELPWNPNRLEQRNGRVDRYGQKAETVYIRTMVVNDPMDRTVLTKLIKKAQEIRSEYGFSPPYLGDDEGVLQLLDDDEIQHIMPQYTLQDFTDDGQDVVEESAFDDELLDRIKDESFYNHTEVDLSEVKERRDKTQKMLGGPDALKEFVNSGLDLFDCDRSMNADGTYEIEITTDELRGRDVEDHYERVTFEPNRAAEDDDAEMLDIAHPLVQRLIESVKEVALTSDDRYGRTAMRGTDAVDAPTAVYTYKIRYFAHTGDEPTVMEELVQLGLPLYGDKPLSAEELETLQDAESTAANRTEEEWRRDLEQAVNHDSLEDAIRDQADQRRSEIEAERREMRESLQEAGYGESMTGIDNLSVASRDLLTIGLNYPSQ
ncbi:helicase-related protein [Natronobacterium texcoconense]|uniref:Superfamily II DNA or RNA helicase, SNF2 family n=1 Tax=Natronobacterium texcoconense TaxID=1095778 RepID=A0A1H1FYL3_NATTX|nr:helicase-related protein [Natronobacterium texcoconense]SDR06011.1 Superfamily II DNA or RNA helicase, SNF2 family [Natronobacterium texcoconense]